MLRWGRWPGVYWPVLVQGGQWLEWEVVGGAGRENPWGLVCHSLFSDIFPKTKLFWRELGDDHEEGGKKVREEGSWGYWREERNSALPAWEAPVLLEARPQIVVTAQCSLPGGTGRGSSEVTGEEKVQ